MKRLFAASLLLASSILTARSAFAASTTTGGAQIQWNTAATATLSIVTQYSAAGAQGNATPTLLPSAVGVCTAAGTEANFTLTYGALNPQSAAPTGCLYKNALAVSVKTNDASGFTVKQYLDATPTTGIGICAFPNGYGGAFPMTPAVSPVTASSASGNPAAGTYTGNNLTACAGAGQIVPPGTGGASSAGTTPGNPGAPGLEFYSPATNGLSMMSMSGPTVNAGALAPFFTAEDVQVNLARGASSTTAGQTGVYMTIELIIN
ncbi:MAG: hypothetical protein JOZ86_16775 [Candidatus Eremiobacteraeota bacterium]|nr:hypothetical protein [Candidatus Eremiobacteraeota bacterium]